MQYVNHVWILIQTNQLKRIHFDDNWAILSTEWVLGNIKKLLLIVLYVL